MISKVKNLQLRPTTVLKALVVIAIVAMWLWIYLYAPRDNPDRLQNRSFPTAAEAICAPIQTAINALPTGRDVDTVAQRLEQIVAGTELTETMLKELKEASSQHVSNQDEWRRVNAWFADWDAYLKDRRRHVDNLEPLGEEATGKDLWFTLDDRAEGGVYTERIDGFANVNDMESCHTPLDL